MDATIANPFKNPDQFGGPCQSSLFPLIGCHGLILIDAAKLIGDHTSRDFSTVHKVGYRLVEDVNISENGNWDALMAPETEKFIKFARIESYLCDEKVYPLSCLLEKFVVLGHHLGFIFLERGDGAAF